MQRSLVCTVYMCSIDRRDPKSNLLTTKRSVAFSIADASLGSTVCTHLIGNQSQSRSGIKTINFGNDGTRADPQAKS